MSKSPLLPHPRPAGSAAGPLRPRPVRLEPGRRAAFALAPGPGRRAGLPGAVPGSSPPRERSHPWLAAGSETVQQQALRDFSRAMTAFFDPDNPAGRPSWRKAGRDEGFRITGRRGRQWDVLRVSRKVGQVWVPKAGWVRFRWSRAVPPGVKSYRVRMDRAGRWHVAFAAVPDPVPAPGNGEVVGIGRGVSVALPCRRASCCMRRADRAGAAAGRGALSASSPGPGEARDAVGGSGRRSEAERPRE